MRIPPENKGISKIVQFHDEDVGDFFQTLENQQSETGKNAVKHQRTLFSHTELSQVV
jgi:hypothetical protein